MSVYTYFIEQDREAGVSVHGELPTEGKVTEVRLYDLRDNMRELGEALRLCREKLEIYREHSDGEYHGGLEHTALIQAVDNLLRV